MKFNNFNYELFRRRTVKEKKEIADFNNDDYDDFTRLTDTLDDDVECN